MHADLISVVLCTYNGEKFLEQQLNSIINQSYPNLEIIIFDDASTDGTKLILQKYQQHSNIHIHFNEKNVGFARNFERAVSKATAEYICFADQDDIWMPEKTEMLYNNIGNHSMIYSNSLLIDKEGKSLDKFLSDFRKLQNIYDSRSFVFLNAVTGHTMMMKRAVLEKGLPLPEFCYHDWWFAIIAANMNGIIYLDKVLTHYRQHIASVTKTIVKKKSGSRTLCKRYEDYLQLLTWIDVIRNNPVETNKAFFDRFYQLFSRKSKQKFSWTLWWFMLSHRTTLFKFSQKSPLSQIVEIRKFARGEKEI
jgi:glycosyltransferase involved in cell wall biosynthesis